MALSVLPTNTELAGMASLNDVVTWTGLNAQLWNLVSRSFGTIPNMRVLAMQPPQSVLAVINGLRIPVLRADGSPEQELDAAGNRVNVQRGLSMVESVQVALVWRVCRLAYSLPDMDLYAPAQQAAIVTTTVPPTPSAVGSKSSSSKKIKVSQVMDQMDDTELDLLPQSELDLAFRVYVERMGSEPLKEHEPSPEQITAMFNKVVTLGDAPYADFSVLTPFGRRSQRQ